MRGVGEDVHGILELSFKLSFGFADDFLVRRSVVLGAQTFEQLRLQYDTLVIGKTFLEKESEICLLHLTDFLEVNFVTLQVLAFLWQVFQAVQ